MSAKKPLAFWLTWATASALGAGIGFACAFVGVALVVVLLLAILETGPVQSEMVTALTLVGVFATGLGGLVLGGAVGFVQSLTLPWPAAARRRWRRWNIVSWAVGSGLGLPLAMMVIAPMVSTAIRQVSDQGAFPTLEVTAAIVGLFVGLGTHRALPRPAPPLVWWVAGTVVATTLGWVLVFPVASSSQGLALPLLNVVVGSLVYGMVSGGLMVWADRVRLADADRAAVSSESVAE